MYIINQTKKKKKKLANYHLSSSSSVLVEACNHYKPEQS